MFGQFLRFGALNFCRAICYDGTIDNFYIYGKTYHSKRGRGKFNI